MNTPEELPPGEELRKAFEKAIADWETVSGEVFPLAEKQFIDRLLEKLEETEQTVGLVTKEHWLFSLITMLTLIPFDFLPSQLYESVFNAIYRSLLNTGMAQEEAVSILNDQEKLLELQNNKAFVEAFDKQGVMPFLWGCFLSKFRNYAEAKDYFDDALKRLIPRKERVHCMQLRAWCCVYLGQWKDALEDYETLEQELNLARSKELVEGCIGYIRALQDYSIMAEREFLASLPREEFEDAERAVEVAPKEEIVEVFRLVALPIPERMPEQWLEQISGLLKEQRKEAPETPESTEEWLKQKHGEWIEGLANKGALINAEHIYRWLGKRSWSEVVMGYCNAVEAESKSKVLKPLELFLRQEQGSTDVWLARNCYSLTPRCSIADLAQVLRSAKDHRILGKFFSRVRMEDKSFLLDELPKLLHKLIGFRNRPPSPAHGEIVTFETAEEARVLVLGTAKKPGLLERLSRLDLGVPYY